MTTIVTRAGKGSALTWTEGDSNFTNLNTAKLENVVEDTTPQLGGNLDVNGNAITSASNGNIVIEPNGTGDVHLVTDALRIGDLNAEARISTYGTGNLVLTTNEGNDPDPSITIANGANAGISLVATGTGNISLTPTTGKIILGALDWPTSIGTNGQVLTTNGSSATTWTTISSGGISNVVEDTTPQLGGNLDVNGQSIVSVSNGNIMVVPHGTGNINLTPTTGKVVISATSFPTGVGSNGQVLTTDGTGNASWTTVSGGATTLDGLSDVVITAAATNDVLVYNGTNWVDTAASTLGVYSAMAIDIFSTDGNSSDTTMYPVLVGSNITGSTFPHIDSGGLSFNASTNTLTTTTFSGALNGTVGATTPTTGAFTTLSATGAVTFTPTASINISPTGITNTVTIAPGTTGGSINNMSIGGTTKAAGTFTTMTADTAVLDDIRETVFALTYGATITPDAANGSVQTVTLTGNVTFSAFTNPVSGQSITLIITQDATGSRTLTSTMKFAGGSKTLTTAANSIDILTVSYIGTTYYASLSKAFA
jgi:hypothetical protein